MAKLKTYRDFLEEKALTDPSYRDYVCFSGRSNDWRVNVKIFCPTCRSRIKEDRIVCATCKSGIDIQQLLRETMKAEIARSTLTREEYLNAERWVVEQGLPMDLKAMGKTDRTRVRITLTQGFHLTYREVGQMLGGLSKETVKRLTKLNDSRKEKPND